MANPLEPLRPADLAILQGIVDDYYARFLAVVARSRLAEPDAPPPEGWTEPRRQLTARTLRDLADGRVYSASQALANGLIDRVGYLPGAIESAKRRAGVARASTVMYHRPWGYRPSVYAREGLVPEAGGTEVNLLKFQAGELLQRLQPRAMYLWTGRSAGR
jgi:protease-4